MPMPSLDSRAAPDQTMCSVSVNVFSDAMVDLRIADRTKSRNTPQTLSPSHRLAYADADFLLRDELRGVRLQLELLKPELIQSDHDIRSTVVIFGSTRIPDPAEARNRLATAQEAAKTSPEDRRCMQAVAAAQRIVDKSRYYDESRRLAQIIADASAATGHRDYVVATGGGPGIMEAANRGAQDHGGKSIGLGIVLPHEQQPNDYVTPELCFQFHYFAVRKMHFLLRAKALVFFPGGFGTLDELFESLTLVQTHKVKPVPILLFGRDYWDQIISFQTLADEGTIAPEDLDLFDYVETADQAWQRIEDFYRPAPASS